MTRPQPDVVVFRYDERREVLAAMASLQPEAGWLTLQPGFDAEATEATGARPGRGLFRSGPAAPTCTWLPGERSRRHGRHTALGVEHGAGTAVADVLADRRAPVLDRWLVTQDNAIRGLVVVAPADEAHDVALDWLLRAGVALSTAVLTGEWRALVHRRR